MTENIDDKNKAFTLAETLIVLAVLGIVAAITIPPVVRQHMEAMCRTKIKKSMSVYDLAIQKMTVENDLKSDTELINWSNEVENCGNTVPYFKAQNRNGCTFKTSDGVWWNISDIMNPIIALSEQALNDAISNGIDGIKSFKLVASFDRASGAFRVDDLNYEKLKFQAQLALSNEEDQQDVEDNVEELEKLYGFVLKKDKNDICGDNDIICKYKRGDTLPICGSEKRNCVSYENDYYMMFIDTDYAYVIYDNNGNKKGLYYIDKNEHTDKNGQAYKFGEHIENDDGSYTDYQWGTDYDGNIYKTYEKIYNKDGSFISNSYNVDNNNNIFKSNEYMYNVDGSSSQNSWAIDSNNNIYKRYESVNNADKTYKLTQWQVSTKGDIYKYTEQYRNNEGYGSTFWKEDSNGNIYEYQNSTGKLGGGRCTITYNPDGSVSWTSGTCD